MGVLTELVSLIVGLTIWLLVLRDSFVTLIQPRTVDRLGGFAGLFYHWGWRFWSGAAQRVSGHGRRLQFLSAFGPISVVTLLMMWAVTVILAFALIYHGLECEYIDGDGKSASIPALIYMSGSTFLTLGLGDITTQDAIGRLAMIAEAGTGLVFLSLVITYMPILDAAYGEREIESLMIQTRTGRPHCATQVLRGYFGDDEAESLLLAVHDAERWFATILQSHISHPIVAYYRAQRRNSSWLVSYTLVMDTCAILITAGDLHASWHARATFRMGLRLLHDLTTTLAVDPVLDEGRARLTEGMLDDLVADLEVISPALKLDKDAQAMLLRLSHLYDAHLRALGRWLVVDIPGWLPVDRTAPLETEEAWPWERF